MSASPRARWSELAPETRRELKPFYDEKSWNEANAKQESRERTNRFFTNSFVVCVAIFWFAGSVANNTTTKVAMKAFPYPLTVAYIGLLVQLVGGTAQRTLFGSNDSANFAELPSSKFNWAKHLTTLVVAVGILFNFVFHRVALKHSTVPFTHTAKSSATVFVAVLSTVWLGERLDRSSWLCIGLLISGIALATSTELEFSMVGLLAGFAAALGMALQVVGSKALMQAGQGKASVYVMGMLYATVLFLPVWLVLEAPKLSEYELPEGMSPTEVATTVLSSSLCLYWQEGSGFWFLTLVGPISHSMGNGVRSLVVIAIGAWYFRTQVGLMNAVGVLIAVVAVSLHGYLKNVKKAKVK